MNIHKIITFCLKMLPGTLLGLTFIIAFSRLTQSYEMALIYIAIGLSILMWVVYRFIEKGVGKE